jgi:hypothetical protein
VDDLNVWVLEQRLEATVGAWDAEGVGLGLGAGVTAAGDGHNIHVAKTTDGVEVMRADEAGADESHSDAFHVSASCAVKG